MDTKKTIMLCDGFEVTFTRRLWTEASESLLAQMEEEEKIANSDLSETAKRAAIFRASNAYRENVLSRYVENWDRVKPRLSVAGFQQLEKALEEFSKAELIEGN